MIHPMTEEQPPDIPEQEKPMTNPVLDDIMTRLRAVHDETEQRLADLRAAHPDVTGSAEEDEDDDPATAESSTSYSRPYVPEPGTWERND